jgi:DNA (cytosine-5)-methyltransferase 1
VLTVRIGSLCTGTGALDSAVQSVLGGELAWVSDPDPGATALLAHHYPDVPNHGDLIGIDLATVERVDLLTAGFPCQDISSAGRRAGLRHGNRTGLWLHIVEIIDQLRPSLVVTALAAASLPAQQRPAPESGAGNEVIERAARAAHDAVRAPAPTNWVGSMRDEYWFPIARAVLAAAQPAPPADTVSVLGRAARGDAGGCRLVPSACLGTVTKVWTVSPKRGMRQWTWSRPRGDDWEGRTDGA